MAKMESELRLKTYMSLTALSLLFLANGCFGYPNGAPEGVCGSMTPQHSVAANPINTSPYAITLHGAVSYKAGQRNLVKWYESLFPVKLVIISRVCYFKRYRLEVMLMPS